MTPLATLTLATIDRLTGGPDAKQFYARCPECSDRRSTAEKRKRKTLCIWYSTPGFASYSCAHCHLSGYARDHDTPPPEPRRLATLKAEATERERVAVGERVGRARWLWSRRQPLAGTLAERYLRTVRGYGGRLPETLGFLPGGEKHPPAMIAAFGMPVEIEPGVLAIEGDAVLAVHLTRLDPSSARKAVGHAKVMVGAVRGSPIVVAPATDSLALVIAEGIEDALSAHMALGCGAWAAGSASFMPALADAVPAYVEVATILVDGDEAGRRGSGELGAHLRSRGIEVCMIDLSARRAAA